MKSPWKWFSGLRAKRSSAQDEDATRPDHTGEAEAVSAIVQLEDELESDREAVNEQVAIEVDGSTLPANVPVAEEPKPSSIQAKPATEDRSLRQATNDAPTNDHTSQLDATEQHQPTAIKKRKRLSASNVGATEPKQTVAVETASVDPMASLDADIRRLRAELSEKLRIQNDQLSKLLDRYK
ncbi:hypothetical protein EHI47_12050 [Rhizobium leguminosarum]|uniref:Uncharacterized protein n=1 Tax=Rhizobium leguminosarum TaxID=384 RepID=A0A444I3C2_RHILE|nr:hypothetical protein [Rhizobium leguminosarum]RWX31791.1 hypothetical protein EHI47_12050 [Rhizobium leguminosarum]